MNKTTKTINIIIACQRNGVLSYPVIDAMVSRGSKTKNPDSIAKTRNRYLKDLAEHPNIYVYPDKKEIRYVNSKEQT